MCRLKFPTFSFGSIQNHDYSLSGKSFSDFNLFAVLAISGRRFDTPSFDQIVGGGAVRGGRADVPRTAIRYLRRANREEVIGDVRDQYFAAVSPDPLLNPTIPAIYGGLL